MIKGKNRKLYISVLMLFHGVVFTVIMNGTFFTIAGIILFIIGGIYFVLGIRDKKEKN